MVREKAGRPKGEAWRKLADELVEERLNRFYADAWSCPEVCLPCLFDLLVGYVISSGPILADLSQNGAGPSPVLLECRFEGLPGLVGPRVRQDAPVGFSGLSIGSEGGGEQGAR